MRLLDILNNLLGTQFAPIHEQPRLGDVRHSLASITKINGALGFTPLTSFQKGLEQTLKWYQSRSS
jgi:UDP-glucose 4-epimerase